MEVLPEKARHCGLSTCHQLDFLPFQCKNCKGVFCLAHREFKDHACPVDISQHGLMPRCPICNLFVHVKAGESPDDVMNAHIASGCKSHILDADQREKKAQKKCGLKGCKNEENFDVVVCPACKKKFCLTHRHAESHKCASLSAGGAPAKPEKKGEKLLAQLREKREAKEAQAKAKAAANGQAAAATPAPASTASTLASMGSAALSTLGGAVQASQAAVSAAMRRISDDGKRNGQSQAAQSAAAAAPSASAAASHSALDRNERGERLDRAAMIRRLKVKAGSVGDERVPESERFYLEVSFPPVAEDGSRPKLSTATFWFNRQWTVGKVMDVMCEKAGFPNKNNVAGAKKLQLVGKRNKAEYPADIAVQLLDPALVSGDEVLLQYVPDGR